MKKEYKRVFIDTAPLIYLLDNDQRYVNQVKKRITKILNNGGTIVISPVTIMEYLVVPYREKRYDRITSFYDFVNETGIEICNIDAGTATESAQIRAEYSFRSLDAMQLACAARNGCDAFLTNDRQLMQYKGIRIDYLSVLHHNKTKII